MSQTIIRHLQISQNATCLPSKHNFSWNGCNTQGPVVRRPISALPGVKFNPGFSLICSKAFSLIILLCYIKSFQSSTCRQKELTLKFFFKLSNLNSNLALTLRYLNPALINSAQDKWKTKVMPNFGRQTRCIMANVQVTTPRKICIGLMTLLWSLPGISSRLLKSTSQNCKYQFPYLLCSCYYGIRTNKEYIYSTDTLVFDLYLQN